MDGLDISSTFLPCVLKTSFVAVGQSPELNLVAALMNSNLCRIPVHYLIVSTTLFPFPEPKL